MQLVERVMKAYQERFGGEPTFIARAPGRVNLLGEHVDYNDGFVMPAAIDRAAYIAFAPAQASHSTLLAVDLNQQAAFSPRTISEKEQIDSSALPDWAHYPAGVMWSLLEENLSVPAINAVYSSNVPRGSGLSSSASVQMAFMTAWQSLGGWTLPPISLALLAQRAENQYVGVNSGIMDQFASACGVENHLLLLDCRSLEWRALPLPEDVSIVIADTSVRRKLTSGEYNKRRAACEDAVRVLKRDLPSIYSLRDVSVQEFHRFENQLSDEAAKRARHVVDEIERTRQAPVLLEAGDIRSFGRLMNECHTSLRDLYEVSCPELDMMVELAQSLDGCLGARLTGAGFGGCTVNLVMREYSENFSRSLARIYQEKTKLTPQVFACRATGGAGLLDPKG